MRHRRAVSRGGGRVNRVTPDNRPAHKNIKKIAFSSNTLTTF
jgi:hypothetical protein